MTKFEKCRNLLKIGNNYFIKNNISNIKKNIQYNLHNDLFYQIDDKMVKCFTIEKLNIGTYVLQLQLNVDELLKNKLIKLRNLDMEIFKTVGDKQIEISLKKIYELLNFNKKSFTKIKDKILTKEILLDNLENNNYDHPIHPYILTRDKAKVVFNDKEYSWDEKTTKDLIALFLKNNNINYTIGKNQITFNYFSEFITIDFNFKMVEHINYGLTPVFWTLRYNGSFIFDHIQFHSDFIIGSVINIIDAINYFYMLTPNYKNKRIFPEVIYLTGHDSFLNYYLQGIENKLDPSINYLEDIKEYLIYYLIKTGLKNILLKRNIEIINLGFYPLPPNSHLYKKYGAFMSCVLNLKTLELYSLKITKNISTLYLLTIKDDNFLLLRGRHDINPVKLKKVKRISMRENGNVKDVRKL